jgi:MFS superfamily sulfate permease-like transporter
MMIDVQDSFLNAILNSCLLFILILSVVSLIPWKLKSEKNRWTLALPILGILAYLLYEFTMPNNWDIRLDLVFLWPALAVIIFLGVIRGVLIWRHVRKENKNGKETGNISREKE